MPWKRTARFLLTLTFLVTTFASTPPATAVERAVELFEAGALQEARQRLEAHERRQPGNATAALYLGRIHFNENRLGETVEWLEKAAQRDPESSQTQLWLGRAYGRQAMEANLLAKASLARKVREVWLRAVELDPNNLDARFDLIQFYLQAPALMGGGVDKARGEAEEIARRDQLAGHRARAAIHQHRGDPDAALAEYRKALSVDPEHRPTRLALGFLLQETKDFSGAMATFEALLADDPEDLDALYQLGRTAIFAEQFLGRGEEALRLYLTRQPGGNQPSLAWAHYRLAQVLALSGDRQGEREQLQAALRLDPAHSEARKALSGG